jgi:Flp pilus assembly CpaE family ATPase
MSVALIGPDERRRQILAAALSERPLVSVREFRSYPTKPDDFKWLMGQAYNVIVLDLDNDQDATLELVQRISATGTATVMVFSERADQKLVVRLMRAGAREYFLLPMEKGVISGALARAAAVSRPKIAPAVKASGDLFVFLGAKGGCGVTTASCNFALALNRLSKQKTLLIDLNLPIGDAALMLNLSPEFSAEDAFRNIGRLDSSFLQKLLVEHKSGLKVLPAPSQICEINPSRNAVDKLVNVARSGYDHVIVDLGSKLDAVGIGAFKEASIIYLITQTGIAELRNSNRLISQYFSNDVPKMEVVLNRFEPSLLEEMNEGVVAKALGRPVRWMIPNDQEAAREMQHGETGRSETDISRVCLEMASSITGRPVPPKKKKGFALRAFNRNSGEEVSGRIDSPSITIAPLATQEPRVYSRRTPSLKWSLPTPIKCGDPLSEAQLNASSSIPGTFEYNPGFGEMLAAGAHALSVVFIPDDSEKYAIAKATVTLEVALAPLTISWSNPDPISYGTVLSDTQLCASASVQGSFDYVPAAGEKLTVGTHVLSATFTPKDSANYATTEATVSIEVAKVTPAIDWPTPQALQCGEALSAAQLCARASVPGTFNYSPQQGKVLSAGAHTLSLVFTPTDIESYAIAEAIVLLEVAKVTPTIKWPVPQAIREGTPLGETQLCVSASVPGTFDYSPAHGESLPNGTHTLSAAFTPTDSANYASTSATVSITVVAKAIPAITWSTPDAITYGTPLSATQLSASSSVPGTFHYSPGRGEMLVAGKHALSTAFSPRDCANYATMEVTVPLEVMKAIPTINWPTPQPIMDDTRLSDAQLCASSSVPGRFEYSPGLGEILAPGTRTLSATFTPTDDTNYASNQATASVVVVAKRIPDISWANPEPIPFGTPLNDVQLCATSSVLGNFEYSPSSGEIPPAGKHSLCVAFKPADDKNYATVQATVSLEVMRAKTSIVWEKPNPINYGTLLKSEQLCAKASVSGTFDYTPAAGEMLFVGTHALSVTFYPADSVNYSASEAVVFIDVEKATPSIDWPIPGVIQYGTALGASQLRATASVPGWFSYSPATGEVLAAGNHTLSVVFIPEDSANYDEAQATTSLDVIKLTPVVTWTNPEPITYGTPLDVTQLCATVPVPGTFDYSHELGEMVNAGKHVLSVRFIPSDSANYSTVQAAVSLEVLKATPTIEWQIPDSMQCGSPLDSAQLCATASIPGTFNYSPMPGELLAAGTHMLSVTFSPTDSVNFGTTHATVPLTINRGSVTVSWATPDPISYGTRLGAAQLSATASVPGSFDYSPVNGEMLAVGTHVLAVTFIPADIASYDMAKTTVSLEVVKATPIIDWPAIRPITSGSTLSDRQLCAAASVAGSFDYAPATGAELTAGIHTLSVIFTPKDTSNYNKAQATISLEVAKVIPSIDWSTPRPIMCGTELGPSQLNATAWVPGSFDYSPAEGEVLPAGTHSLSVSFTPVDRASYAAVQAAVLLNVVEKPKPAISWPKPYPIRYGTPLSSEQLCASASVPGTFDYRPPLGEMLPAGSHNLSVMFTPADISNYDKERTTVTLHVSKATPTTTWSNPDSIAYGTPLGGKQLCAAASTSGTFDYFPTQGEVLHVGEHVLSVTFTPNDTANYAATHANVTIRVTKALPIIEWPTPKPVRIGARLNSMQLCATASIPGTFHYSPSSGNVLPEGSHSLSVTFKPIDTGQYETARAAVVLEVRREFRWGGIIAALCVFLLLFLIFLLMPSFNVGNKSAPIEPAQPVPTVSGTQQHGTQSNRGKPKSPRKTKLIQDQPSSNSAETGSR